jgi:signal transduction histidine kinase
MFAPSLPLEVVHEIANPLTAAILNLESLQDHLHLGLPQPEVAEKVHISLQSLEHIKLLLSSYRDSLRATTEPFFQASTIALSEPKFSPGEVIYAVIQLFQLAAHKKQLHILYHQDSDILLSGSFLKFQQIIINLLSNALDAYPALENQQISAFLINVQ